MPGLFVVGTDTGVGKTVVTAGIARCLRKRGPAVEVCKPVATGAEPHDGGYLADDTRRLADAAGHSDYRRVTPWAFPIPAAPAVAARAAGVELALPDIAAHARRLLGPGVLLVVEGVGGLLCPLMETETVADLATVLGLPLVVVARRSLGTLSHTLLTLEVARARGLVVAGVVVSETTPVQSYAEETNVDELSRRMAVPLLAVVPYLTEPYAAEIASLGRVDWRRLAGGSEQRLAREEAWER
jgi:dethiobiotin synthetase